MDFLRRLALPFAFIITIGMTTAGCAQLASGVATIATEVSSSTPLQVKTYAEAVNAATLVTTAVDVYVNVGHPDRATLLQIKRLSDQVHAAYLGLRYAQEHNQSLVFASFNASLSAFNSFATLKGIPH